MPHHPSRQQRSVNGTSFTGPIMRNYATGRMDFRSDAMVAMPPTGSMPRPHHHHRGMHPWVPAASHPPLHPSSSQEQITMSMSNEEQHGFRRVPIVRKSQSSDCTSPATTITREQRFSSPKQDYSSSKGIAPTPSSSFDSPRQMAASSVLLLARETPVSVHSEREGSTVTPSINQRSRPLKKRKPPTSHPYPCHVSPMSSQTSPDTPLTNRGSHDDEEEHQPKKSKTETTKASSPPPPSQVMIPHFPSILHMLLTSTSSEKVIQWLEHGKAWKIVRWEALRRDILPQFFPQLREESGSNAGSIDAFLKHLAAWGFEEVTDGPDVGAYAHEKFCRDKPEMCRGMQLARDDAKEMTNKAGDSAIETKKKATAHPQSILRVPSLATSSADPPSVADMSSKDQSHDSSDRSPTASPTPPPVQAGPNGRAWVDRGLAQPVFVNYRPEEMLMGRQGSWQSAAGVGMTMIPSSQASMPPYSPIRIRSGRGRSNFFVSNRGRRRTSLSFPRKLPMARPEDEEESSEKVGKSNVGEETRK